MLLRHVRPIIRARLAKGAVKTVGSEDLEELEADGMAQAANMLGSAEQAGKEVKPNSVAFYVLQALRSGRRFGSAGRSDAMAPSTQLDGNAVMLPRREQEPPETHQGIRQDAAQTRRPDPQLVQG